MSVPVGATSLLEPDLIDVNCGIAGQQLRLGGSGERARVGWSKWWLRFS